MGQRALDARRLRYELPPRSLSFRTRSTSLRVNSVRNRLCGRCQKQIPRPGSRDSEWREFRGPSADCVFRIADRGVAEYSPRADVICDP